VQRTWRLAAPAWGRELTITKGGGSPIKDQHPPEQQDKVLDARLSNGVIELSATGWLHSSRTRRPGKTVCLYLSDATSTELRKIFAKLSQGADPTVLYPLRTLPFGSFGHLADKYGVPWFFQGENQEEQERTMNDTL
jgi:uncharacterized glyoxalase superfamily protein PhnB